MDRAQFGQLISAVLDAEYGPEPGSGGGSVTPVALARELDLDAGAVQAAWDDVAGVLRASVRAGGPRPDEAALEQAQSLTDEHRQLLGRFWGARRDDVARRAKAAGPHRGRAAPLQWRIDVQAAGRAAGGADDAAAAAAQQGTPTALLQFAVHHAGQAAPRQTVVELDAAQMAGVVAGVREAREAVASLGAGAGAKK